MSDENSASYAKIGFVIVLGAVAIAAVLFYLGDMGDRRGLSFAETYCDKPVSGLSVGSVVNFRGVKIGQVAKIGFVGDEYGVGGPDGYKIYILMSFPEASEAMLRRSPIQATVTASGVTGLSRVEINTAGDVAEPPPPAWTPRNMYIPYKPSLLDSFSDSATKVMNQINKIDISSVWSNISESVKTLSCATGGARSILESSKADIEKIVGDFTETASAVRGLAEELRTTPSLLFRERVADPLPETERKD